MTVNLLAELVPDPVGEGAVQGEIAEFATDRIVVDGAFTPGDGLHLRPGVRVAVLGEAAIGNVTEPIPWCPQCDDRAGEIEDLQDVNKALERKIRDLQAAILDLEGQLVDAKEQLNGALKHQA